MSKAILALEDGTVFEGSAFGAPAERAGEVVFNTSITGYQEIFTDPSYAGQIVILTYPQIGNYGTTPDDSEAVRPHIEGLVVREFTAIAYDLGIKRNILRRLVYVGCRVTMVPAFTTAEEVLALAPDGVLLSNGPGDPEPLQFQNDLSAVRSLGLIAAAHCRGLLTRALRRTEPDGSAIGA